jgi:dihydroorotase
MEEGVIKKIAADLSGDGEVDCSGKLLTSSFIDMSAHFADPGFEHREDIRSGAMAAAASGFGQVCLLPNTQPAVDSKGNVEYLLSKSKGFVTEVLPYGAISVKCEGESMSEMHDLHEAGVVGFTDGLQSVQNSELLLKSMQYVQKFGGLVINHPGDQDLERFGQMHEGVMSTNLGMKGMPSIAESIMIERDLKLLDYASGRLHFARISTKEGVELIRKAKAVGMAVSADVAISNLLFTDEMMADFDTNYKVYPPLRSEEDRQALHEGLKDGTIDAIVSHHLPHDEEGKKLEFDLAEFGMNTLESFYPMLLKLSNELPFELLVEKITSSPRKLLGLPDQVVAEGQKARLAILDNTSEWLYDRSSSRSKSLNSPYLGATLVGKCLGVINGERVHWNK